MGVFEYLLSAHFSTVSLSYDSTVAKCDTCIACTPTCEMYFELAIFSSAGQEGGLELYPGACSYQEHAAGIWNYPDQEISRQIPNMSTGATFYFALFDEDAGPLDEDDLLGAHAAINIGPTNGNTTRSNNDLLPTGGYADEACDQGAIDDDSFSDRFQLVYSTWFTDATAPAAISNVIHSDANAPTGYDNDLNLNFSWSQAFDVHSGIHSIQYQLRKDKAVDNSGTLNPSATSTLLPAVDGSTYDFRLRAQNDASVQLLNQAWSGWSPWTDPVDVDASAENIIAIIAYTEEGGIAIPPGVEQPDNSPYLEWEAAPSVSPIAGYSYSITAVPPCTVNTANAFTTLSGLGNGITVFRVRAIDVAGNCGSPASFEIVVLLPEDTFGDGFETQVSE